MCYVIHIFLVRVGVAAACCGVGASFVFIVCCVLTRFIACGVCTRLRGDQRQVPRHKAIMELFSELEHEFSEISSDVSESLQNISSNHFLQGGMGSLLLPLLAFIPRCKSLGVSLWTHV